jgi:L-lactate utilization protein LutC
MNVSSTGSIATRADRSNARSCSLIARNSIAVIRHSHTVNTTTAIQNASRPFHARGPLLKYGINTPGR